jgi:hypothetical protein
VTFFEAPCPAHHGGHRLVDAGRTPNSLCRMVICTRCGGKILARSPNDAGGKITVWSCSLREQYRSPAAVGRPGTLGPSSAG